MSSHGVKQYVGLVGGAFVGQWAKNYGAGIWATNGNDVEKWSAVWGGVAAGLGGIMAFKGRGAIQYAGFGMLAQAVASFVQGSKLGWGNE